MDDPNVTRTPAAEPVPVIAVPSLEYATEPSVGGLALTRTADGVTVVVRPTRRRVLAALGVGLTFVLVAVGLAAFAVVGGFSSSSRRTASVDPGLLITAAFLAVTGIASAVPALVSALHGATWEATPVGAAYTGRRWNGIVRQVFPAAEVAAVRVERVRIKGHVARRRSVVLVGPNGRRRVVAYGTADEQAFLAAALAAGLGRPADPMHVARYPADPPRRTRLLRVVNPFGVAVVRRPPAVGWVGLGWLAVAAVAAVVTIRLVVDAHPDPFAGSMTAEDVVVTAVVFALAGGLGLLGLYRLRRTTTVTAAAGGVTVSEQSPIRPGWPTGHRTGSRPSHWPPTPAVAGPTFCCN